MKTILTFCLLLFASVGLAQTNGTLFWAKFSSPQYTATFTSVAADHLGNVYACGYFSGFVDVGTGLITGHGGNDALLVKYSSQGDVLWAKDIGTINTDQGYSVAVDSQNNAVVTGYYADTMNLGSGAITPNGTDNNPDIFVAKYSPSGSNIWTIGFGSVVSDFQSFLGIDHNDDVLVASQSGATVTFGNGHIATGYGGFDLTMAKYSGATGSNIWGRMYGSSGNDRVRSVAVDANGDLVAAGQCDAGVALGGTPLPGSEPGYYFVAKYSGLDGSYIWSRSISNNLWVVTTDPTTTNVFVGGHSLIGLVVKAYNSAGTPLWDRNWGDIIIPGGFIVYGLAADGNGNLAMTGICGALDWLGTFIYSVGSGYFVAQITTAGTFQWAMQRQNPSATGYGICFDGLGHIIADGNFSTTIDCGGISAVSGPTFNTFVAKYQSVTNACAPPRILGISGPVNSYDPAAVYTSNVTFTASCDTTNISYQWKKQMWYVRGYSPGGGQPDVHISYTSPDNTNILWATNSDITITNFGDVYDGGTNIVYSDRGYYTLTVSNGCGTTSSNFFVGYEFVLIGVNPPYTPILNGVIDTNRLYNWIPGVTVGVRGGIPTRTTIYTNLSPTATASDINTALANCPSNEVVFLSAGTYLLSNSVHWTRGVTLRGAGAGQTILVGRNASGYPIQIGDGPLSPDVSRTLTLYGANRGKTNASISATTNGFGQAITAGDIYLMRTANDTNRLHVISVNGLDYVIKQPVRLLSVSSTNITFTPPLVWDFTNSPKMEQLNGSLESSYLPTVLAGLENLTVTLTNNGVQNTSTRIVGVYGACDSWVTGCNLEGAYNYSLELDSCVHCTISSNIIKKAATVGSNHGGLLASRDAGILVENDIFQDDLMPPIEYNDGFVGNAVFACFFTNNAYASDIGSHNVHPMMNLFEANVLAQRFQLDGYFGSVSHETLYRNRIIGNDLVVAFKRWCTSNNVILNVLGTTSSTYSNIESQINGLDWTIYQFGYPNIGNNTYTQTSPPVAWDFQSGAGGPSDFQQLQAGDREGQLVTGNWDAFTSTVRWDTNGMFSLPSSLLYTNGAPSWWGTCRWPPVDPTNNVYMASPIPAELRYLGIPIIPTAPPSISSIALLSHWP